MDNESPEPELPRGVALAWGISASPQRGPRRELNIERIVETAVQIADEKGLSAVSMSSVSAALGFTTMSLYRYVTAKDDLILLMQEAGFGQPPLSIADASGWRDGLTLWYRASLEMYAEHPWILDIPIVSTPNTPNNLAWLDAGLAVLRDTRLTAGAQVATVLLLSGQSRWEANVARGSAVDAENGGDTDSRMLASLVTPELFPYLYPAIQAGAFRDDDDDPFEFGISRILDGLERHMAEVAAGNPGIALAPADPAREFPKDEGVKKARERVKDAEGKLRDARQKEREAVSKARERARP
ncbi:MAG TPA: TetR/AcrR family transcriptional regulator C-terminal domain-containing protein [Galbitalea sp.]